MPAKPRNKMAPLPKKVAREMNNTLDRNTKKSKGGKLGPDVRTTPTAKIVVEHYGTDMNTLEKISRSADKLTPTEKVLYESLVENQKSIAELSKKALKEPTFFDNIKKALPHIIKYLVIFGVVGFSFWKFDDMAKAATGCYKGSTKTAIPETKVDCSFGNCDCSKMKCPGDTKCIPCSAECTDANGFYYVWREFSAVDMVFQSIATGAELIGEGFMNLAKPLVTVLIYAGCAFLGFLVLKFLYGRLNIYLEDLREKRASSSIEELQPPLPPESLRTPSLPLESPSSQSFSLQSPRSQPLSLNNEQLFLPRGGKMEFGLTPMERAVLNKSDPKLRMQFHSLIKHANKLRKKQNFF